MAKKCKYKYLPPDKVIRFNDNPYFPDPDIEPFDWTLPVVCPPLEEIEGYGLAPEDQYFDNYRKPYTAKLQKLQRQIEKTPSQRLDEMMDNPEYYKDEIEFILQEWDRRINGHWLFIKGKPTYITGDHYFYLKYYPINNKLPSYRKRDRIDFLFQWMCELDPMCFGDNYPKMRREGATNRRSGKRINRATSTYNWWGGLQSKNADHADEVHRVHIQNNFKKLPFFFVPIWDNNSRNASSINFFAPTTKDHPDINKESLESKLDFKDSSITAYDGLRLNYLHNDEIGKVEETNVKERWDTQKLCLLDNGEIIGKASNTSTVEEMERGGGMAFKEIADQSHYKMPKNNNGKIFARDETGATMTGLYNHFIPSYEGLVKKEYKNGKPTGRVSVDKYGDTDYAWTIGWIVGEAERLRKAGDIVGWMKHCRQFPLMWKDCWRISAKDCNFDIAKLDDRIEKFKFEGNPYKTKGNFEWIDGIKFGKVRFVPCENGRFWVSYQFENTEKEANSGFVRDGIHYPANHRRFVAGSDPMKWLERKESKKRDLSDGGGMVFRKRDLNIDPETKDINTWITYGFCCSYRNRPGQDIYCEDMLMMCIYYGCEMNTETNVDAIAKFFTQNGYAGYLYHSVNLRGEVKDEPGQDTTPKIKEDIFSLWDIYIRDHCHREVHDEVLEECKFIQSDMSPFDRFVAGGKCLQAVHEQRFNYGDLPSYGLQDIFKLIEIK